MKIQNAIVSNILDRSQRYFAHVTTVTLSWRVQNIVVIGHVYFTLECFEFSSNFEFDRNMLSGTGAWSLVTKASVIALYGSGHDICKFSIKITSSQKTRHLCGKAQSARDSKVIAIARAQLTFQMLTTTNIPITPEPVLKYIAQQIFVPDSS